MNTKTLGWLVGLGAIGCSFASCSEPKPECQVELAGNFPYIATYIVKGTAPTCTIPGFIQAGDLIGMEFYHPANADKSTYDDTKTSISLQADWLGNLQAAYANPCTPKTCGAGCTADTDCSMDGTVACYNGSCATHCGPLADGCGGLALPAIPGDNDVDCGGCPSGQTCGGGGTANVCGTGTCTKTTCDALGFTCGKAGDGCGGTLDCGTCTMPDTCGGNGIPGVCGSVTMDTSHLLYSTGDFTSTVPNSNDICPTANILPAEQNLMSGPMTTGSFPAVNVDAKYTWTNLSSLVNADAQGTQFSADLHFSEMVGTTTCEVDYHVIGVWPAVDCTDVDADGNPVANLDLCNPCSEPDKDRPVGSGINQGFPIACNKIFGDDDPFGRDPYWCVLSGTTDPPQRLATPVSCQ